MSDIMKRLIGKCRSDEIEIIRNQYGHPTHFKGLNGKLWGWPGVPFYGDRLFFENLSAVACGLPKLNEVEQQIFETVLPLVSEHTDRIDEQHADQVAGIVENADDEWWHLKQCQGGNSHEAEMLAFRIAERLAFDGGTKENADDNAHSQTQQ